MSSATLLHTQLLNQAKLLATKEPRRPKQGSLRRSISSSYYAVYHFLTDRTTRKLIGTAHNFRPARQLTRRAFEHGEMKQACKSFQHGTGSLPNAVSSAMGAVPIPDALKTIAGYFVDLQSDRHDADYDISTTFRRRDALNAHGRARDVIKNLWPQISSGDATRFFMIALLSWNQISRR